MADDLTQSEAHFAFGKNWAEYARKITEQEIAEAQRGLVRLLGGERLDGKRFLDIGCGSGVHSLAALRMGAAQVVAIDLDADSVATARALLERHAPESPWRVERRSVFDLDAAVHGTYEIVYSWGVLHHTGDMVRAIRCAAKLVAPDGLFLFALYRRTWWDWFWKWEKRWYSHASPKAQGKARRIYVALFRLGLRLTGRRFSDYVASYRRNRGMDYYHDVHDWLGGWPYETISPAEVESLLRALGFEPLRLFVRHGRLWGRDPGVFGSGCDEYVYRRKR